MIGKHDLSDYKGLGEAEVKKNRETHGYNELPASEKKGMLAIFIEVIKEPMFLLLIACGAIYFFLGDVFEAIPLLLSVFAIVGITFYQEQKTERALDALRDLSSPRALVIRDGVQKRIPGREVVIGDIMVLSEGDRVPADAVIIESNNLTVDESLLTGESVPVRKINIENENTPIGKPGGDDTPFVFSGTLIVSGTAVAKVRSIGTGTEMGKIGKALESVRPEKTRLETETKIIVKDFGTIGIILCTLVIIILGITRGDWLESFLAGIALAMSVIPEEFPVVLTIFLALGAWRMSKKQVLARQKHAIQALGSVTVLCVDKTGTLTRNQMTVKKISDNSATLGTYNITELPENFHALVEYGILSSQKDPFDPMEKALKDLSEKTLKGTEHSTHAGWELLKEYPLSRKLLAVSHVWKSPDSKDYIIAAKGAPEAIIDLCHLKKEGSEKTMQNVMDMAKDGLRVIAVAKATMKQEPLPNKQHDFTFEFLGIIGLEDPVREGVKDAIAECYSAGIRTVMITGDYPETARNIATQIGLKDIESIITGPELDSMSDDELIKKIPHTNIFARVVPEQKLRIVNAFKISGEIVAMTGDGVNDAPALKSANIGIAMGARGTDVAREASSVVLLDDDFSSIVGGVRMGRRIFDNIRKAMAYVVSIHMPIAGLTMLAVLLGWPLILLPIHIVFLELLNDPACSIVFEAERGEKNIMQRPPRNPKEKIFNKKAITMSILQGIAILAAVAIVFSKATALGHTETQSRALAFMTLIIANLMLIVSNLSWSENIFSILRSGNRALTIIVTSAIIMLIAIFSIPLLGNVFSVSMPGKDDIIIAMTAAIACLIWFESLKIIERKIYRE